MLLQFDDYWLLFFIVCYTLGWRRWNSYTIPVLYAGTRFPNSGQRACCKQSSS